MADHFVDATNGNNANDGHTMDTAWATLQYAVQSGALVAGDIVWVRRGATWIPTTDIIPAYIGTFTSPIQVIGCPRTTVSITSSDWTNGSNVVTIDDNNMVKAQHCGRYITAPNGQRYMITRVISTSSINIDNEYSGATVTNQAVTIHADEDYELFNAIDDSTWTIKKTNWNSDTHALSKVDFNSTAYQLFMSGQQFCYNFKNLEFANTTDNQGLVNADSALNLVFQGCIFTHTNNNTGFNSGYNVVTFIRCIAEGTTGRFLYGMGANLIDCAIYGFGSSAIYQCTYLVLDNVNLGVEVANGGADIFLSTYSLSTVKGKNVKLGGANGYIQYSRNYKNQEICIENYQKILNSHRTFFTGGFYENSLLTTGTTPNKKLADYAIKITPNRDYHLASQPDLAYKIFEHRVWADTTSKSYRYWIYNNMSAVINDLSATQNLFLKVTYISSYDDTSEYTYTSVYSSQIDIAAAADATDWDYLEITGIQPAVAGWVILEVYLSMYSATGTIYIDPSVVIS